MLKTVDRSRITSVPRRKWFDIVVEKLGSTRTEAVRTELDRIIDEMQPEPDSGSRTFSSSHLGSKLSPWQPPLQSLYDVSREMLGSGADEEEVQRQAGLIFGLFVWECILNRDEEWVFWDPNLSAHDPNREITGKVYFEQT